MGAADDCPVKFAVQTAQARQAEGKCSSVSMLVGSDHNQRCTKLSSYLHCSCRATLFLEANSQSLIDDGILAGISYSTVAALEC